MEEATTKETRLRLTVWPGVALPPVPLVTVWELKALTAPETAPPLPAGAVGVKRLAEPEWAYLHDEFYLRALFDLDLDDESQLGGLYRTCGFMFGRHGEATSNLDVSHPHVVGAHAHEHLVGSGEADRIENARNEWAGVVEGVTGPFELYDEARLGIVLIRDLARLWAKHEGQDVLLPGQWEGDRFGIPAPRTEDEALVALTDGMTAALSPFTARVQRPHPDGLIHFVTEHRYPSLFSVLASQLFNHIVKGASYKRCALPDCGATFVRQQGRSKADQGRTRGVSYCSRRCANLAAKRRQRKNAKTEKGEHS